MFNVKHRKNVIYFMSILFMMITVMVKGGVPNAKNVHVASVFSSNMVLQRECKNNVWGTAKPGGIVLISINGQKKTAKVNKNGNWNVVLEPLSIGGPYEMSIKGEKEMKLKNIMVGDVWLCSGQSNMELSLTQLSSGWDFYYYESQFHSKPYDDDKGSYKQGKYYKKNRALRYFIVPDKESDKPESNCDGSWKESEATSDPSKIKLTQVGYYFARSLHTDGVDIPIGLIKSAVGSTSISQWTSPLSPMNFNSSATPYKLYNGMINPLLKLSIKGVIWYQGEDNVGSEYSKPLLNLINDWRARWHNPKLPFYVVQISSWGKYPENPTAFSNKAKLRDDQLAALKLKNTAVVITTDLGDKESLDNIHPPDKLNVGKRLALVAEKNIYGKDVVCSSPVVKKIIFKGNKAIISFKNAKKGLVKKGDKVIGFAIAGKDGKYFWANCTIKKNRVTLSASSVKHPKYVRYAWSDNPGEANLYNSAGLPVVPFRTDTKKED